MISAATRATARGSLYGATRRLRRLARWLLVRSYYAACVSADGMGALIAACGWRRAHRSSAMPYAPGVSIIIPERDSAALLRECLTACHAATRRLSEPSQIVVVVNGCAPAPYASLQQDFPEVQFAFFTEPLGFSRAIEQGLELARYDWVYLLNSDMVLDPDALRAAARRRASNVFAIASQIFFVDPARRREETGWTDFALHDGWVDIFDVRPDESPVARGNFYAGGGASLFRKSLLLRFLDRSHPYEPLYWEDVEWGTLAWRTGHATLFCPESRAWHHHRATVSRFYTQAEIEQIFRVNGFRYQMRNFVTRDRNWQLFRWLANTDGALFRRLLSRLEVARTLRARFDRARLPFSRALLFGRRGSYYPLAAGGDKPWLLVVSPFAVYPPVHGSARRTARIIDALSERFRVVLLSDEAAVYDEHTASRIGSLTEVHLVQRPRERCAKGDRVGRIQAHCHPALAEEMLRLLESREFAAVQVEHVELAGLVKLRKRAARRVPWFIVLHDVLLSDKGETAADRYERRLIDAFDAVVTCSSDDAALLPGSALIPNGVDIPCRPPAPSAGARAILFCGPFRYPPNLAGIRKFAARVFPRVRAALPQTQLWILGGAAAPERAGEFPELQQAGIMVFDQTEDVAGVLARCALTVNPMSETRGSSIKLLESLAAGRVCVSTLNGARGMPENWRALVTVPGVEDMAEPLLHLLANEAERAALEGCAVREVRAFDWRNSGEQMVQLIESLLARTSGTGIPACRHTERQEGK